VPLVAVAACGALLLAPAARAVQPQPSAIVGAWTLNKDLSDQPPAGDRSSGENGGGGRSGGYGRGGSGGGMHGGGHRGGMGGGGSAMSPEDAERMRAAMRDEMTPPEQMTIVQSDSMILMTSSDGRTLRLSPDGKKVKDENTKIERKTKWDGAKLVSEVNGLGRGKITETYAVDPETHRLTVSLLIEGGRNNQTRTVNRVYDPAPKG
jgi:hypothetical protein